jgi:hypothetical protein
MNTLYLYLKDITWGVVAKLAAWRLLVLKDHDLNLKGIMHIFKLSNHDDSLDSHLIIRVQDSVLHMLYCF